MCEFTFYRKEEIGLFVVKKDAGLRTRWTNVVSVLRAVTPPAKWLVVWMLAICHVFDVIVTTRAFVASAEQNTARPHRAHVFNKFGISS